MASARDAGLVYVVDCGEITEHGTHASLMAARGLYRHMFTSQADRFGGYR